MALFDGDMVTVTTPDGRQVQMPAGLATQFPQLQQAPPPGMGPPPIPDAPQPPPFLPDQQAQLAAAANVLPDDGPVTRPSQVPQAAPPVLSMPRGAVTAPAEAPDAGPPNTAKPPGPLTNDQLAKMGNAGVYNQAAQGLEDERSAIRREGAAMADQATQVGNKMAAVEDEAAKQLEARRAAAEANAQAIQSKTEEYLRRAQQIADTKIDRSSDHPVLSAIGIMLTTMGAAMAGRDPSVGVKSFYEAIDRKVAGQMQDLDQQRQGLAVQKEGIGLTRQAGMDRLAEMDTYRLGYLEQAKRQIATIQQKTQSPIILAQTDKASAMITQKQNEILGSAVQREQQKRDAEAARAQQMQMHRESLALQRRGQNMEQERFLLNLAEQRQEKADALAAAMAARGDKVAEEKAKKLGELGIMDPSTGNPMMTPEGLKKMADADRIEAAARKAKDPEQAKAALEQATLLRQSAMVNDAALANNNETRKEAERVVKQTQDITNRVDAVRRMLSQDPSAIDRDQWAEITVALEGVKINFAQLMGERMSPKALDAITHVLSIDPDSWTSRTIDRGKALAALKQVETQAAQSADVTLKTAGVKSGWQPNKATAVDKFEGQTAEEVGRGAESGLFRQYVVNPIVHPIDTARGIDVDSDARVARVTDEAGRRTTAKGESSRYGLEPDDDVKVRSLIKRSGSVGNAEYDRITGQLAAPLIAQAEKRPSLVRGIVNLVKDEDPKLFADVMAKVASSGGKVSADNVAAMVQRPVTEQPVSMGGPTPDARAQLEESKVRAKFGVPAPSVPVQMPPMTDLPPSAPQLPPFFDRLAPADQQRYLAYLRSVGVAGGMQ